MSRSGQRVGGDDHRPRAECVRATSASKMAVVLGTKTIMSPRVIDGLLGSAVDSPKSTVPSTLAHAKHPARRKSASATAHTARQNALLPPTNAVNGKMAPADHQLVERQTRRADRLAHQCWVGEKPRNSATKSRTVLTGSW